ncbi:uncharacterized protein LOC125244888 [Megalobrama amblycephala]|uniref:uncharacterized protein LOC125244888 n=1 Tax=Megalobrama amblycephala TaxID=75352 RepID=UPI002014020B|nr:uncharacterized protein LOC125244888 [Megalobrama amblycephala]
MFFNFHFVFPVKQKFDISTDHKVYLADETGTEVDEDVFADIIEQKADTLWMVVDAVAVADSPAYTSYASSNETDSPSLHSVASSSDTQPSDSDGPFFPPKRARSDDHLQEAKEVLQDFELLFGVETASKLLEKWDSTLKQKVIQESKNLTHSLLLSCLIQSAEHCNTSQGDLDSDMFSLLLLVYLLPPPSCGNKKFVEISVHEALDHVVRFYKSCYSFEEVLGSTQTTQPYILAVGTLKSSIHDYYISVDERLIPCMAKSSLCFVEHLHSF